MTDLAARLAARRPHVLAVEVPGQWRLRARVEHELARRGWPTACSPADADVLAVCGRPGPDVNRAVDLVWDQLPGPRVRISVSADTDVPAALADAVAGLRDTGRQREDARRRATQPVLPAGDMDHGDMDHGDMDHGDMDHGDMDHGDMDMAPAGIPLAEGAEDRDGLEMDVLHIRLGPILPYWPGGLVLHCTLHGDVIAEAHAAWLDAEHLSVPAGPDIPAARQCDHLRDLLALAGVPREAERARRARDAILAGAEPGQVRPLLDDLERGVRRGRMLRWSLRGLGSLAENDLHHRGEPAGWAGDVYDRLLRRIQCARNGIDL
ncbi:MAG: hypothetical protein SW019_18395, partial [Actinomycetota bacterium]|nr:hypothetical protein [Actinomycetota bacterium]